MLHYLHPPPPLYPPHTVCCCANVGSACKALPQTKHGPGRNIYFNVHLSNRTAAREIATVGVSATVQAPLSYPRWAPLMSTQDCHADRYRLDRFNGKKSPGSRVSEMGNITSPRTHRPLGKGSNFCSLPLPSPRPTFLKPFSVVNCTKGEGNKTAHGRRGIARFPIFLPSFTAALRLFALRLYVCVSILMHNHCEM